MTSQKHKPDNSRRSNKDRRKLREEVIEMDRRRERRSNSPQFPSVFRTLTVLCVIFLSVHSALGQTSQNILRPIITASKRPLVELELATLECKLDTSITPTSSAPPLTWSRVGGLPSGYTVTPSSTDIGEGFTSYTSVLSFIPVGRDHEQMFTCSATLAQFTGQTTYLPEVILKPSLPVITGPSVVNAFATETWRCVTSGASINHPSVYFRNGDGIHLSLGISSSPTADVDADGIIVFTENVLLTTELPATQPTYTLTCNVVHSYQDYNFFAEASLSITVRYVPQVTKLSTDTVMTTEGIRQTISCVVENSSPVATSMSWTKDGIPVVVTGSTRYEGATLDSPSLVIRSVVQSDEGEYICSATNSEGTGSFVVPTTLVVRRTPVISYTSLVFTGNLGGELTLPCPVDAIPPPSTIRWWRELNGVSTFLNIPNEPRYTGGTIVNERYGLTINPLQTSDEEGLYYCQAINDVASGTGDRLTIVVNSFPVINTPVTSVVAVENLPVTLTCTVNSQESLTELYWTRDGVTLTTTDPARYSGGTISTPSLTILAPGNADVGTYVCVARNSVGLSRSDNIGVTLNFRPRISVPSEDITSAPGGIVRLDCQVTAATPGVADLYWNKAGLGRIDSAASAAYSGGTLGDPTLVISSAQFSDSGDYTCVASNSVGTTISDVVSVSIISIPQVSIAPATTTLEEGSGNVVFSCIISANPAVSRVSWTKDGSSIDRVSNVGKYVGGTVANSDLTVNSVDRNDAGDYRCEAENSQGIGFSTVARLDITYEPTITVGSTNIVGSEGGTITLTCGVAAFPLPTNFYWNKNGTRLDLSSPIGKYSGGTLTNYDLTISNLDSTSDTDVYTCVAENSRGNTVSDPIALGVSFDPVVNVDTNVVGKEGQPLTIRCEVSMFPPATSVLWFKDGTEIRVADDPTRYSGGTLSNPTLTVLSASGADSGTYICQANNNVVTTDSPSITVLVTYAPKVTTTTNAVETTASASTSVTLVCQVDAVPLISSLVWTRIPSNAINPVATVVTIGGRFSGASTTSPNLIISGVNSGDAGTYFCDAGNSEGSNRSPDMALTVRYGPENLAVTQDPSGVLSVGDTFTLTCSADSFPLPSAYTWYRGDTVMANSATFSTQATTDDFATYRCDVANSISSASSSMLVDVRFPPTPKSTTPEIRIVQIGGSVTLTCDVSANPTPIQYRWFKDPNEISGATERTLNVQVASVADVGTYSCLASNSIGVGTSNPEFRLVEGDPVVGQSTADEGLSTATIILIVVICIILLIIIILLLIFCCFQGTFAKCCGRSPEASRVAPTPYTKPPATNGTGAFGPVYTPEANGVSKVDIEASPFTARTPTATGLIISVPEMTGGRAHHLPPLGTEAPVEENYYREEKRRTRKKRRHRRKPEDTDALTIDIQGDSPTPERPQD